MRRIARGVSKISYTARVVVKVRYAPFVTVTHGAALTQTIEAAALAALDLFEPGRPVRLLGVRAEFGDGRQ